MKKKVLFNIATLTGGGGAEKILTNIVNCLNKEKYDISIVECIRYKDVNLKIENHIKILQPFIDRSKKRGYLNNKLYLLYDYVIRFSFKFMPTIIRKILIKERYDIEVGFNYMGPSFIVSRKKESKRICWVHGSIESLNNTIIYKILQKKAFKKLDKIITISEISEKSIRNIYESDKIIKINNGYNFEEIYEKSNIEIEFDENAIIFVGRLDNNKRVELLVDAIGLLKQRRKDFKVYIIGDGPNKKALKKKIEEKKINKYIRLMGYIENPYPYIKKAKLICLTSISEGFPTVLVEAMSLGCPFVSTDVGGVRELSNNQKCGLIVKDNEVDISIAINELLNDDKKRIEMSNACKEGIKQYSLKNQIEKIEKIFEE